MFEDDLDPVGFPGQVSFVHKRLIGAVKGFVTSGFNPLGAVGGFVGGGAGGVASRAAPLPLRDPRVSAGGFVEIHPSGGGEHIHPGGGGIPFFAQAPTDVLAGQGECPGLMSVRNPVGPGCINLAGLPPGGAPALTPGADRFGQAVVGAFGMAALVPAMVGVVVRADGTQSPIRRCPRGAVLGKFDNLCYDKGSISNKNRKWPAAKRAPVSASDAACIRRATAARGRVKKLAKGVGFKVTG